LFVQLKIDILQSNVTSDFKQSDKCITAVICYCYVTAVFLSKNVRLLITACVCRVTRRKLKYVTNGRSH